MRQVVCAVVCELAVLALLGLVSVEQLEDLCLLVHLLQDTLHAGPWAELQEHQEVEDIRDSRSNLDTHREGSNLEVEDILDKMDILDRRLVLDSQDMVLDLARLAVERLARVDQISKSVQASLIFEQLLTGGYAPGFMSNKKINEFQLLGVQKLTGWLPGGGG